VGVARRCARLRREGQHGLATLWGSGRHLFVQARDLFFTRREGCYGGPCLFAQVGRSLGELAVGWGSGGHHAFAFGSCPVHCGLVPVFVGLGAPDCGLFALEALLTEYQQFAGSGDRFQHALIQVTSNGADGLVAFVEFPFTLVCVALALGLLGFPAIGFVFACVGKGLAFVSKGLACVGMNLACVSQGLTVVGLAPAYLAWSIALAGLPLLVTCSRTRLAGCASGQGVLVGAVRAAGWGCGLVARHVSSMHLLA
jgi:hypothetical protein